MRKEIRFSSLIDTKEFDAAIDRMQKKLQDMYKQTESSRTQFENKQKASSLGLGPAPTAGDRIRLDQEERRSRTEMDRFIKTQIKDGEVISRELAKQLQMRRELLKISQQDADAKKRLADIEKQISINREKQNLNEKIVKQALDQRMAMGGQASIQDVMARAANAYAGAGMGGAGIFGRLGAGATAMGRGLIQSPLAIMGLAGAVLGGIGMIGSAVSNIGGSLNTDPRRQEAMSAQAIQNFSSPLMSVLREGQMEEAFFAKERAEALKEARKEISKRKKLDILGLASSIVASAAAPIATAGLAGKALGFGAMALAGAPITLAAGALAAGYMAYKNFDDISGFFTGRKTEEYSKMESEIALQRFEAKKQQDPLRQYAFSESRSRAMQRLPTQQALGLSDRGIAEIIISGTESGFTEARTLQSMQSISQAGAGTRASRELATLSNILNRGGITNAQSILGKMSAMDRTGMAESAESSITKMLAEGVRLGLDGSDFAKEQNKYFESLTDYFARVGAQTAEARSLITEGFGGAGMVSQSMAGVSALMESKSLGVENEKTMIGSAIRMASLESDPNLAKLDPMTKLSLAQMDSEQLKALKGTSFGAFLESETGMKLEDIARKIGGPAQTGPFPQFDQALEEYQRAIDTGDEASIQKAFGKVRSAGALIPGFSERTELGREQFIQDQNLERIRRKVDIGGIESLTSGEAAAFAIAESRKRTDLTGQNVIGAMTPSRLGEKIEADRAVSDAATLNIMSEFSEEIEKSVTQVGDFTSELKKATEALRKVILEGGSEEDRAKASRMLIDSRELIESRQPQTKASSNN